jgi:hypothetical protein
LIVAARISWRHLIDWGSMYTAGYLCKLPIFSNCYGQQKLPICSAYQSQPPGLPDIWDTPCA